MKEALVFDFEAMKDALSRVFEEDDVFEIRILGAVSDTSSRPHTESGYFDYEHIDSIPIAMSHIRRFKGAYYTPNPLNPAILARRANRIAPAGEDETTKDSHVRVRRWFLIDCDPVRAGGVTGIGSSEEEHGLAFAKAREVMDALALDGWGEPVVCDSGNGAHLMYRVEDSDASGGGDVFRGALETVVSDFSDGRVSIDGKVFNPARIWRLPGTVNSKGDSTDDRPHRMCRVVSFPGQLVRNPVSLVERLASYSSEEASCAVFDCSGDGFDIDSWIASHCAGIGEARPWNGGRKWVFKVCPFNEEHSDRSACIVQRSDGRIGFVCHHNGCAGRDWHSLRDLLEPGWREARRPAMAEGVDISGIERHDACQDAPLVVHEAVAVKPVDVVGVDDVDSIMRELAHDRSYPWRCVTESEVEAALEGTYLGRLNDVFASVTEPRLPLASSLLKSLALLGCCLTCEASDELLDARFGGNLGSQYLSGVLRAKTYIDTGGGQLCNFYCLLVGNSGSGKDVGHLTNMFANFPNPSARPGAAQKTFLIGSNGSPEGMADALQTIPNGLMILSEMENFFDERHWQRKMMTFLTESWDIGFFNQVLAGRQRGTNYCAPNAIGNIQTEVFRELATEHLINTGAFSRWLVATMPEEERFFGRPSKFDSAKSLSRIKEISDVFLRKACVVDVPQGYSDKFYDMMANRMSPRMDATWTRYVNMYYPRLATILSVTDDPATHGEGIVLDGEAWRRAETLILWFVGNAERVLENVSSIRNPEGEITSVVARKIYRMIAKTYAKTDKPVSLQAIARYGFRDEAGLKSSSRQRRNAVEELIGMEAIIQKDGGYKPWKRILKWEM